MAECLIAAKEKGKKETRATFKSALEEFNISNNNYPIVLEKLTCNVFSRCMSTINSKESWGYLSATSYGGVQISLTHPYSMSVKKKD